MNMSSFLDEFVKLQMELVACIASLSHPDAEQHMKVGQELLDEIYALHDSVQGNKQNLVKITNSDFQLLMRSTLKRLIRFIDENPVQP